MMNEEDVRKWNKWFYGMVKEMRKWQRLYYSENKKLKTGGGNENSRKYYLNQSLIYENAVDKEIQRIEEIKERQMNPTIDFGDQSEQQ